VKPERRRPWLYAAALIFFFGLVAPGVWLQAQRALGPLDLAPLDRVSTVALDRDGRLLRAFETPDGRWRLPLSANDVDPRFFVLLKAYEDRRFDRHHGVDFPALLRASWQFARMRRVVSGGSTLTMQAARLLEPRPERDLFAKARQILRAFQLEARFSKSQILDIYLALAPYGGNLEGLRAASLAYFGKEPRRLSTAEAALLVAIPQSP
jgi:penicillin-binding protein 1C